MPLGDRAWRFRVGYLPENPYLYDYLTPRASTSTTSAGSSGCPRRGAGSGRGALLALVGLRALGRPGPAPLLEGHGASALGLAQALINDPELVILDEPMSGLDPLGRRLVREPHPRPEGRGQDGLLLHPHPFRRRDACVTGWPCSATAACVDVGRLGRDPEPRRLPPGGAGVRPRRRTAAGCRAWHASPEAVGERRRLDVDEKALVRRDPRRRGRRAGGSCRVHAHPPVPGGLLLQGDGGRGRAGASDGED